VLVRRRGETGRDEGRPSDDGSLVDGVDQSVRDSEGNVLLRDKGVFVTTFQVDTKGDTDLENDEFLDGSWSLLKDAGSHPGFYFDFCAAARSPGTNVPKATSVRLSPAPCAATCRCCRHTRRMTDEALTGALADTIETARSAERDLFGGLESAILERPIREGDWNPKDFQAHLTAWKARQADRLGAVREGRTVAPGMDDPEEDALNAELRAARIDWDWVAVVQEADAVTDRLIQELRQSDPDALRASDRLLTGTFGNGVLHTLTHVRWLLEAGVPLDHRRVAVFEDEALRVLSATAIPDVARAVGTYDLACYHALRGSPDLARSLLRDAFRIDPELIEFSRTDEELHSLRGDLEGLAG